MNVFFVRNANGTYNGKRRYTLGSFPFTGIATPEIYLIKAECMARRSLVAESMIWLDRLLSTRYRTGTYTPKSALNAEDALGKVLVERRKELVLRGLRWYDLRRFNTEGRGITISRVLNGNTYTLPPGDPRYTFPIPLAEVNNGLTQNQR